MIASRGGTPSRAPYGQSSSAEPLRSRAVRRGRIARSAAALVAAALLAGGTCEPKSSAPPRPFATADLAGDWFEAAVYAGQPVLRGEAPGWTMGRVSIDASGLLAYAGWVDALGGSPPDGLQWSADPSGDLASTSGYAAFYGRIAGSRDTVIAATREDVRFSLRVLRRIGPGAAAVASTAWRYHAFVTGGDVRWEHGAAAVGADGVLALAGRVTAAGALADEPRAATLSAVDGEITGTDDTGADVLAGWISPDGQVLVLAGILDDVNHVYWTMIALRDAGGFVPDDLLGPHTVIALDANTTLLDGAPVAGTVWSHGENVVYSGGGVTFGPFATSSATSLQPGPVTAVVAGDGETTLVENPTYHGVLSDDDGLLVATATITPQGGTPVSRLVFWVR